MVLTWRTRITYVGGRKFPFHARTLSMLLCVLKITISRLCLLCILSAYNFRGLLLVVMYMYLCLDVFMPSTSRMVRNSICSWMFHIGVFVCVSFLAHVCVRRYADPWIIKAKIENTVFLLIILMLMLSMNYGSTSWGNLINLIGILSM